MRLKYISLICLCILIVYSCKQSTKSENDNEAPVVTILTLKENDSVFEILTISVIATDNDAVEKVELWLDGKYSGTSDNSEPYKLEWNTTEYENKTFAITVRVYDVNGNKSDSDPINIRVNNNLALPTPINVTSVSYTLSSMTIQWNKSQDSDFVSYTLLTSNSQSGSKTEITTFSDINTTSHSLNNFDPTHENWFWIKMTDTFGYTSEGNGQTNPIDKSPTPSILNQITYANGTHNISWSQNNDNDFQSYSLFESQAISMDNPSVIFYVNSNTETNYAVIGVSEAEERYYQIVVEDIWGLQSLSNIQGGTSDNTLPTTTTSTILVKTEPDLRAAVQVENSYIIIENNITLTTSSNYLVGKGVIINGYGSNYGTGGTILYANGTMPSGAFFEMGKDSEIWGIRLIGNNSFESKGINIYNKNNAKIKKCEIVGFGYYAISLGGNTSSIYKKGYISSNYIHDNQQSPYGYGIVINKNSEIYINFNKFKNNRHHVTSRDLKNSSDIDYSGVRYEASYNTILENSDDEEAHFDVHGNDSFGSCWGPGFLWDNGQAGNWIKIHHNQFLGNNNVHVLIRGVPVSTVSSGGGYRIYSNNFGPDKNQIMTCEKISLLQTNVAVLFTDPNLVNGDNFNTYVTISENY